MLVNGTVIGQRTFNLDNKSNFFIILGFVFDLNQNILSVITFGPTKKGFFFGSN
jgi:hypothetical protein